MTTADVDRYAPTHSPLPGDTPFDDDLVLVEHLRRGNDLDVYDAWSHARGTSVVVKVVRPDRRDRPRTIDRLLREGDLLLHLTHPHIVRCYTVLRRPTPALVLETLAGRTLSALLDDQELSSTEVGHLGLHLASAVRYLHRHGTLHLDLKPSNVIEDGGRAKLLDLSIARAPGRAPAGMGTWGYRSPEQVAGGVVGPPADVWGLGATLYEAATGVPAFAVPPEATGDASVYGTTSDATGATGTVEAVATSEFDGGPEPLASLRDLPADLVALIHECLLPDPDRRPSIDDLLARLEPIAGIVEGQRRFGRGARELRRV